MQSQHESINDLVDSYASQHRWAGWLPQPVSVMLGSVVFAWLVTTTYSLSGQPIPWPIWLGLGTAAWVGAIVAYLRRTQDQ